MNHRKGELTSSALARMPPIVAFAMRFVAEPFALPRGSV